jgi:hypothetical protein
MLVWFRNQEILDSYSSHWDRLYFYCLGRGRRWGLGCRILFFHQSKIHKEKGEGWEEGRKGEGTVLRERKRCVLVSRADLYVF